MRSFLLVFLLSLNVATASNVPDCLDSFGRPMPDSNENVLRMMQSFEPQLRDRGYIRGVLVEVMQERPTHIHLDVFLGAGHHEKRGVDLDIEVIYNKSFGAIRRELPPGLEVIACGEFINGSKKPDRTVGAKLHWVHMATRPGKAQGYLMIDGELYGQEHPRSNPRDDFVQGSFLNFWKLAN
jgi:hypothetical protein